MFNHLFCYEFCCQCIGLALTCNVCVKRSLCHNSGKSVRVSHAFVSLPHSDIHSHRPTQIFIGRSAADFVTELAEISVHTDRSERILSTDKTSFDNVGECDRGLSVCQICLSPDWSRLRPDSFRLDQIGNITVTFIDPTETHF